VLGAIDLRATDVAVSLAGTTITLAETPFVAAAGLPRVLTLRAIGEIYAENALAALAGAIALGIDGAAAAAAIAAAAPPPGRFEVVHSARASSSGAAVTVVVDYAHTPDALARTIATARALAAARPHGPVTVVFGAGGNRDAAKRPALGAAARGADRIVLTNDNPRDEDPQAIVDAIAAGVGRAVTVCLDRSEAIFQAIQDCSRDGGGIVILAGKGHETTQTIGGAIVAQSDRELALAALQKLQLLGTA
jgi:UDP-N-acetylmuramoyl-L-alanyl-D-glutamate--2,6-diaminopimelate ligase